MDKKIIIILSIILVSLMGVVFIVSLLINNNKKQTQEVVENPIVEEEGNVFSDIPTALSSLKSLIDNIKITQGGYQYINDNEEMISAVNAIKEFKVSNMKSNVDKDKQIFCFSLTSKEGKNFCIDNLNEQVLEEFTCSSKSTSCVVVPVVIPSEGVEGEIPEIVPEEEVPEIIPEEQEPILKQEVTVGETVIKRYDDEGKQVIYINDKEYGPYEEAYIIYKETDWGLLLLYQGSWYVDINGKVTGPYTERPVVEFYGEDLGYSYLKDGKYYVSLNNETYGPYDDLVEFNINN
ncbi:MAG: hypothetical protein PHX52_00300 [Candidatus Pacebacteria bacterium]|nr:hypothetical protein [Candidatus Paceibacterota bacterium]MDD3919005.1 hypothetical protein [Candidatus Paceibacterota bacterium]